MVKIRLRRIGAKKRPFYRIVVADSRTARDGRFIEIVGTYDPTQNPPAITVKQDRIEYWLGTGAQPSDVARGLLKTQGFLGGVTSKSAEAKAAKAAAKEAAAKEAAEAAAKAAAEAAAAEKAAAQAAAKEAAEAAAKEAAEAAAAEAAVEPEAAAEEAPAAEEPAAEAAPAEEPAAE